jgi:hypothetical protein
LDNSWMNGFCDYKVRVFVARKYMLRWVSVVGRVSAFRYIPER